MTILERNPPLNRIRIVFFLAALALAPAARAAGPHGDVFVGYSSFGFSYNNGAEAAIHLKLNRFVGVEGEMSGYENGHDIAASHVYLYLFGPRVTVSAFHTHVFAHALGGRIEPGGGTATSGAFLYGLGGGVDLPVFSKLNWRVSGDYVRSFSDIAKGSRISTGPVFRF